MTTTRASGFKVSMGVRPTKPWVSLEHLQLLGWRRQYAGWFEYEHASDQVSSGRNGFSPIVHLLPLGDQHELLTGFQIPLHQYRRKDLSAPPMPDLLAMDRCDHKVVRSTAGVKLHRGIAAVPERQLQRHRLTVRSQGNHLQRVVDGAAQFLARRYSDFDTPQCAILASDFNFNDFPWYQRSRYRSLQLLPRSAQWQQAECNAPVPLVHVGPGDAANFSSGLFFRGASPFLQLSGAGDFLGGTKPSCPGVRMCCLREATRSGTRHGRCGRRCFSCAPNDRQNTERQQDGRERWKSPQPDTGNGTCRLVGRR